jgi:ssDNA-binding Zn-finger/Zn-ribbon topoisomerase 1
MKAMRLANASMATFPCLFERQVQVADRTRRKQQAQAQKDGKGGQINQKNHRNQHWESRSTTCNYWRQQNEHRQTEQQGGKENDQADRNPHPQITPQAFCGEIAAAKSRVFAQNNASMPRNCNTDASKYENQASGVRKHCRFDRFRRGHSPFHARHDIGHQRKLHPVHDAHQRRNHRQP